MTLYFSIHSYANSEASSSPEKSPLNVIDSLFKAYKTKNYDLGQSISLGKFNILFNELMKEEKAQKGILLNNVQAFSSQLDSFKILGYSQIQKNALVSLLWILKVPSKYTAGQTYTKAQWVEYLLVQKENDWKILDARFKTEYIIYDVAEIYAIEQEIKNAEKKEK